MCESHKVMEKIEFPRFWVFPLLQHFPLSTSINLSLTSSQRLVVLRPRGRAGPVFPTDLNQNQPIQVLAAEIYDMKPYQEMLGAIVHSGQLLA